jgi:hypothetical protein
LPGAWRAGSPAAWPKEVLRLENFSVDWTTTTLSPPPLGGLRTVLGEAICFQEALGKYLLLRRSLEKNFIVVRGPEKGRPFLTKRIGKAAEEEEAASIEGALEGSRAGSWWCKKAVGLAPSGAEKTSGIALRRCARVYPGGALNMAIEQASDDNGCHGAKSVRIERPWENGVGRPGVRRPSVAQDQRIFLVEGCPRAIQGRRGSLDAGR